MKIFDLLTFLTGTRPPVWFDDIIPIFWFLSRRSVLPRRLLERRSRPVGQQVHVVQPEERVRQEPSYQDHLLPVIDLLPLRPDEHDALLSEFGRFRIRLGDGNGSVFMFVDGLGRCRTTVCYF